MRLNNLLFLTLFVFIGLVYTGCDDDDPEPENEEELITDVELTLTPQGGGDVVTFTFQDRDGDGGNAPTIVGGTLAANTVYDASVSFFDRSDSEEEDITEEVEEESNEHQVFYVTGGLANITVAYDDQDGDGNPLGLMTTMTTAAIGGGTLTVILLHEPDKNAAGVAGGDPANAGGETDVEAVFPVTIE